MPAAKPLAATASIILTVREYIQEVRTNTCVVKPGWREAMRRAARGEEVVDPEHP